jgi:2-aminoethylphosphonate transport system ATP-binding protein
MRDGKLVAFGDAQSLYRNPPNRFSAEFLGRANLLPVARLTTTAAGLARVAFGDVALTARNHHGLADGSDCLLCVRPHDIRLGAAAGGDNALSGTVKSVLWQGDLQSVELDVGGHALRLTCAPMHEVPEPGATLALSFSAVEATLVPESATRG